MPIHPLTIALVNCLWLAASCGPSITHSPTAVLDYVELRGDDGWYLRVHGDGSGSLTHRQHPTHHLDYPVQTFDPGPLVGLSKRCGDSRLAVESYYSLTYYRASRDVLRHCTCGQEESITAAFTTAIASMQLAVDDEDSERACRMLRRVWLAAR